MNTLPRQQPIEPEMPQDPAAQEQLKRSHDALDNQREDYDDTGAADTPDQPASVSGGPRKKA
jgi:hypothetical protein